MARSIILMSLFLALIPLLSPAAPPPRPFAGEGILIVRPFGFASSTPIEFILYREPGVGRIAERSVAEMPLLSSLVQLPDGEYPMAVMGKKGEWLRVAYDDAGREGWVKPDRWWERLKWEEFLKGRSARLLPGLKKESYLLRGEPSEASLPYGDLTGEESFEIMEVKGDWALAGVFPTGLTGWLPWRDGDGRMLISVGER
jgi:hypothetical protein